VILNNIDHKMINKLFQSNLSIITVLLVSIFFSSFIASLFQTNFHNVKIDTLKFPTQNGQILVADLFKPRSATKDNPAPLVIVVPGFQRSKETLSNISIELSRRGLVVIAIDPYAQGSSSSSFSRTSATSEGYGMFSIIDYIYNTSNLNYINKNKIATTGHSAGGLAAARAAQFFGLEAINNNLDSKLHSAYISGMLYRGLEDNRVKFIKSNIGLSYAFYDEGAFRNMNKDGDMRYAPEAIGLVNSGLSDFDKLSDSLSVGKYYGSLSDRTLRVVHNERLIHPFQPYSIEATKNQLNFFMKVFNIDPKMTSENQIWYFKELFTFFSLICSFLMIIPLTRYLLESDIFKDIKKTIPDLLPKRSKKGSIVFWSSFFLTAFIASFSFIPMSNLSLKLFIDASTRNMTWFFPQRMNNAIMLWALLNGSLGLLIYFITDKFFANKKNKKFSTKILSITIKELLLTTLLALVIFFIYFIILALVYYFFHVDYRLLFIGVRVFQVDVLYVWLMYLPVFFIFFFSNSVRVNGSIFHKGLTEFKGMFFSGFATSIGLLIILFIQYASFLFTGKIFWTETNLQWLYVNLLFGIVPMIFVLPFFNRYIFNMTGRVYLGPMVTSFIFIMILSSNTVCYIPL
tara:strand:- start:9580 stop:11466 length:1887 start_codon:yes stop_codon:yes gene_type:complete